MAHLGLDELLRALAVQVAEVREEVADVVEEDDDAIPTITLSGQQRADAWSVRVEEGRYVVLGDKIERFAARTDFSNYHSVNRLRDILKKLGIAHEIRRQGAEDTDVIVIGDSGEYVMTLAEQDVK
jgi:GTP-binding protein